jgi:hypothetical protein
MVTKTLNRENAKSLLICKEYYRLSDISKLLIDLSEEEIEMLSNNIKIVDVVNVILVGDKIETGNLAIHIHDLIRLFKKLELLDESSLAMFMAIYFDTLLGEQNDNQTLFN